MDDFDSVYAWLRQGIGRKPHLLLGNGFSMAYDSAKFSYSVLAKRAEEQSLLPEEARKLMAFLGTSDFETIMRTLVATADTLEALEGPSQANLVESLRSAVDGMREALARSIAGLHPDRPYEIEPSQYLNTRSFLDKFTKIFSVNYDLLLYWSLMQDLGTEHRGRSADDGFRDSGVAGDDTVLWNIYDPHSQNVYYLHGALHLFLGRDGLRKITWVRTDEPLIDQVRRQLVDNRFPLYVAEGESVGKLDKINRSAYLSKGLRSLTACGGSLAVYGHSLDDNDAHILRGVVRSKVKRLAVSIYGDADTSDNRDIARRAMMLAVDRQSHRPQDGLEVRFYDASSVRLWAI